MATADAEFGERPRSFVRHVSPRAMTSTEFDPGVVHATGTRHHVVSGRSALAILIAVVLVACGEAPSSPAVSDPGPLPPLELHGPARRPRAGDRHGVGCSADGAVSPDGPGADGRVRAERPAIKPGRTTSSLRISSCGLTGTWVAAVTSRPIPRSRRAASSRGSRRHRRAGRRFAPRTRPPALSLRLGFHRCHRLGSAGSAPVWR